MIAAAKAILTRCREDHRKCALTEVSRLPTRVIDVSPIPSDPSQVKLHVAGPDEERSEYVTLSYIWGGPLQVQATRHNLPSLMQGIEVGNLPQTIQDAIHITRELGFRYLWADVLCIIQDSDDDKEREIGKMGYIYRHSALTLAASCARNAYHGFDPLETEPTQKHLNVTVELPMSNGQRGTMSIVSRPRFIDFQRLPLNSRGWAFQEYLLSRRVLFFTPEVVWSCGDRWCGPVVPCATWFSLNNIPDKLTLISERRTFGGSEAVPMEAWFKHVEDYSSRVLTVTSDKEPAITGCINVMQELWGGECLFGLWKSHWFKHAAWYCIPHNKSPRLTRSNRAPSWSWMSVDHGVQMVYNLETTSEQRLVSIDGHKLRLFSPMRPAIKEPAAGSSFNFFTDLHHDNVADDAGNKPITLLYLGKMVRTALECVVVGLVVVEEGQGVFRRVGLFRTEETIQWQNVPSQEIILV